MTSIICPKCSHKFPLSESLDKEMQQLLQANSDKVEHEKNALRLQMENYLKQKEEEYNNKAKDFDKERTLIAQQAKDKVNQEYTIRLQVLEQERNDKVKQVQEYEKKQLIFLREQQEVAQKLKNFNYEVEKQALINRKEIEQELLAKQNELVDLKLKEKDTQMESLRKTIEELKRKSEQGSMQLQGEAQELLLQQVLQESFKYDTITEVGKGVEGADCIQMVTSNTGQQLGSIIYESKNAKGWKNEWIEKLKNDKRNQKADIAILVTQAFPKQVTRFTEIDGVWVCSFGEAIALATVLRQGIVQVQAALKSQENKGDKMQMLYHFLTSNEFKNHLEAIMEGFVSMKDGVVKERLMMEKIWKEREKQIDKVLLNTSGLYGSLKGIAGNSIGNIPLLESGLN